MINKSIRPDNTCQQSSETNANPNSIQYHRHHHHHHPNLLQTPQIGIWQSETTIGAIRCPDHRWSRAQQVANRQAKVATIAPANDYNSSDRKQRSATQLESPWFRPIISHSRRTKLALAFGPIFCRWWVGFFIRLRRSRVVIIPIIVSMFPMPTIPISVELAPCEQDNIIIRPLLNTDIRTAEATQVQPSCYDIVVV